MSDETQERVVAAESGTSKLFALARDWQGQSPREQELLHAVHQIDRSLRLPRDHPDHLPEVEMLLRSDFVMQELKNIRRTRLNPLREDAQLKRTRAFHQELLSSPSARSCSSRLESSDTVQLPDFGSSSKSRSQSFSGLTSEEKLRMARAARLAKPVVQNEVRCQGLVTSPSPDQPLRRPLRFRTQREPPQNASRSDNSGTKELTTSISTSAKIPSTPKKSAAVVPPRKFVAMSVAKATASTPPVTAGLHIPTPAGTATLPTSLPVVPQVVPQVCPAGTDDSSSISSFKSVDSKDPEHMEAMRLLQLDLDAMFLEDLPRRTSTSRPAPVSNQQLPQQPQQQQPKQKQQPPAPRALRPDQQGIPYCMTKEEFYDEKARERKKRNRQRKRQRDAQERDAEEKKDWAARGWIDYSSGWRPRKGNQGK